MSGVLVVLAKKFLQDRMSRYYLGCRDAAACPGGFVTDSSVHHIAALRALAQASGTDLNKFM